MAAEETGGGAPALSPDVREAAGVLGRFWWIPLITGIAWLAISLIVLRFDTRSATTIGVLAGIVVMVAGFNDLAMAAIVDRFRWLYALLGVALIVVGVIALTSPDDSFVVLAALIGWYLLFKGAFDITMSFLSRGIHSLWWMWLIVGIVEILLAFWSAGYFGRQAFLLIIFVGASAMARGITQIVLAFGLRDVKKLAEA